MMERRQIVRLWQQGEAAVLVTLVRAEGSSYRRPGARLLLGFRGEYAGQRLAEIAIGHLRSAECASKRQCEPQR